MVKLWAGRVAALLNECRPPPVSYKTELNCSPEVTSRSAENTCQVTCEAGAQFVSDRSEYVIRCGPSTDFSWTGENTSRLLPSCSGTAAAVVVMVTKSSSWLLSYIDLHCQKAWSEAYACRIWNTHTVRLSWTRYRGLCTIRRYAYSCTPFAQAYQ